MIILQEKVYTALAAALNVPVVKYISEYDGDYPVVVYNEIENAPALFGDNVELIRRVVYQVSIGTEDDEYGELEEIVGAVMADLGFSCVEANDVFDKTYWREIKFVILYGGD